MLQLIINHLGVDFSDPVPPPRAKKKEKFDNSPVVPRNRHDVTSDRVTNSGQDHVRNEKDHMITKGYDEDHMLSEEDHVTSKEHNQTTSNEKDQTKCDQSHTADHVMPDVSTNTVYFEATSRTSLHGNNNDVTDGGNNYDVQKELDEILSKSDLVDGTHLNLPTQVPSTHTNATTTTTTKATKAAANTKITTTTDASTTNTSGVVDMDTSAVVMDTSISLTKSDHTQSSPSSNSNLDTGFPPNSPMSDSVNMSVCLSV